MNIQEDVVRNLRNLSKELSTMLLGKTDELTSKLLLLIYNNIQKDKTLNSSGEKAIGEMLAAVQKGEKLKNIVVPDEDVESLKPFLNKCGALYAIVDMKKDDAKMVIFLEKHSEKIQDALTLLSADRGLVNEVAPELFLKNTTDKEIGIASLDKTELELFRHHAKASGLVFGATVIDDKVKLLYTLEDKDKFYNILAKVSWDLTGEKGPLIRQQIEYRLKGRKEVNIAIEQAEKEYYIVSGNSPKNYVKITSQDYSYYKNNKEVTTISRTEPDCREAVFTKVQSLSEPVVLTKEEFEMDDKERQALIDSKTNVYPLGYSAFDEIEKKYKENDKTIDIAAISFSEFIKETIETNGIDKAHAEAAQEYSDNIYKQEFGVKHVSTLDALIAQAEKMKYKEAKETKNKEKQNDKEI